MSSEYVSFANGNRMVDTFYLPNRDDADAYLRDLASSVYETRWQFERAMPKRFQATLLIPINDFADGKALSKLESITFMGFPMKLTDDVDEPMFAHSLYRTRLPV